MPVADPNPWKTIRVPASSANLGPGFDALGMALDLHLTCRFRRAESLEIVVSGRDREQISSGSNNFIWQNALGVARRAGAELPNLTLEIANDIPLGKGMGSSAAALTAAVVIANEAAGLAWDREQVMHEAACLEGHPDNVAACVLGSIVASAMDSSGMTRAVKITLHERFGVAVVVPELLLPTVEARRVLPSGYSREDTIFNVQRSALLLAALSQGVTSAFPTALEDRMHQPYRAPLVPGLNEIIGLRAPGLLGCVLSGAGPSILVFHERGHQDVCQLVRDIFAKHGFASEVACTTIAAAGFSLT